MPPLSRRHVLSTSCLLLVSITTGCANPSLVKPMPTIGQDKCTFSPRSSSIDSRSIHDRINGRITAFQSLMENLLTVQLKSVKLAENIKTRLVENSPMPADLMDELRQSMKLAMTSMTQLKKIISENQCWVYASPEYLKTEGFPDIKLEERLKGVMLDIAAIVAVYDTYFTTVAVYHENKRLRRFLNTSDPGYGIHEKQLETLVDQLISFATFDDTQEQIAFYTQNRPLALQLVKIDKPTGYLRLLIEDSPSFKQLQNTTLPDLIGYRLSHRRKKIRDDFKQLRSDSVGGLSSVFGNTVGIFESRSGKLFNKSSVYMPVHSILKPGDILLEKTPFRLTDQLIPGYWGHAAIWLGNESELRNLGVWDHPVVQPHHALLNKGQSIVEALRSGVQLSSLKQFLNIDDLIILRDSSQTDKQKATNLIRAFRQVGKEYDFNFDVDTTDKIVCSELVYIVYNRMSWPTSEVIGRHTISPDNIAEKALNGGPFDIVMLYHDGSPYIENPQLLLRKLIKIKVSIPANKSNATQ